MMTTPTDSSATPATPPTSPREEFREFSRAEMAEFIHESALPVVNRWIDRGDNVAVYEDAELYAYTEGTGSPRYKAVSYGSQAAFIEADEPPTRLPDTPTEINWRYVLIGVYLGGPL